MGEPISTSQKWAKRKDIVFNNNTIYTDLNILIEKAKNNELSIAIFKPTKIIDLKIEETDPEWNEESLKILKEKAKRLSLFQTEEEVKREFSIVDKLPFKFYYQFQDCNEKSSRLMIEDWEIGMLYWNCLKQANGDKEKALQLVRKKYFDEFNKRDIYLFLGTTKKFHFTAKNPFVIIGVFYPPHDSRQPLF